MGRFIMKRVLISMLIIFLVSVFAFSLMHILPGDPVRLVLGLSLIHIYRAHVIIGTTQHNSAVGELGTVRHGGSGMTYVGCLEGDVKRIHPVTDAVSYTHLDVYKRQVEWSGILSASSNPQNHRYAMFSCTSCTRRRSDLMP